MGFCSLCFHIAGGIVAAFFLLVGILGFAVPCGQYNSSKLDGFSYESPPATVIAFHWMCFFCGLGLGAGLFIWGSRFVPGLLVTIVSGILLLIFWICYMVFFFTSDEFKMGGDVSTLQRLNEMWDISRKDCPFITLTGTGHYYEYYWRDGKRKSRRVSCRTGSFDISSDDYCTDETEYTRPSVEEAKRGGGFRVYTDVKYEFAEETSSASTTYLNAMLSGALSCVKREDVLDPDVELAAGVTGVLSQMLVTHDGKAPKGVSRGRGIAAGIFFCGVAYSYQVSKIPVLRQTILKTNVTLVETIGSDSICNVIGRCRA